LIEKNEEKTQQSEPTQKINESTVIDPVYSQVYLEKEDVGREVTIVHTRQDSKATKLDTPKSEPVDPKTEEKLEEKVEKPKTEDRAVTPMSNGRLETGD